jgi:dTDP-4-amino-4,6-dideoxygalactose transaminase
MANLKMTTLEETLAEYMGRRYARIVGRGTTALYVALRALALRNGGGGGEIILPDLICSTVLDAVLLAGFAPIFADATPDRFTIDPVSIRQRINGATRGIITAHVFGHIAEIEDTDDFGVPVIEDAVQGLGGAFDKQPVGTLGKISFASFDETKMIGGRGGIVTTDDPTLWELIQRVSVTALPTAIYAETPRLAHYREQLAATASTLIRPFDNRDENVTRILAGWKRLSQNVRERNEKAQQLQARLSDLPLTLPEIRQGDAVWRYTFAAPNRASAAWILRHLQLAGVQGSNLYPSLSDIFAPEPGLLSASIAPSLVNLWVDQETGQGEIDKMVEVIRSTPWKRLVGREPIQFGGPIDAQRKAR